MLSCAICSKPVNESDIVYWSGKNIVLPDKTLQKVIDVPFCGPDHSLEWHQHKLIAQ